MRWAVEMRTTQASAERFQKAFDSGEIVRLHLMRGTLSPLSTTAGSSILSQKKRCP